MSSCNHTNDAEGSRLEKVTTTAAAASDIQSKLYRDSVRRGANLGEQSRLLQLQTVAAREWQKAFDDEQNYHVGSRPANRGARYATETDTRNLPLRAPVIKA
jgi:hypothetical protein